MITWPTFAKSHRSVSLIDRLRFHPLRRWLYQLKSNWQSQQPLAELSYANQYIVQGLRQQGVFQTSLEALDFPLNPAFLQASHAMAAQLPDASAATNGHLGHCIHGDAATLLHQYPEILLWGLQERLLDIVENYMGMPVSYLGVDLRKDIPNGEQVGTRYWHTDGEDTCVVKIAVYLTDVEREHGPFECISKTQFNSTYRYFSPTYLYHQRPKFRDENMAKIVSPEQWTSCIGQAGSVIMADTSQVLHHGAVPRQERIALFFAYATHAPKNLDFCKEYFPVEHLLPSLKPNLSPRQWDCLWAWRQQDIVDGQPQPLAPDASPGKEPETLKAQPSAV